MLVKKRRSPQKFLRAFDVLRDIADTFEYIYAATPYRMPPSIGNVSDYRVWRAYKESQINRRYLYALKRSKLIETRKIGEQLMVRLTDGGYRRVLRGALRDTKKKCVDGACFVTFDIPESQRAARGTLRRLLRECGFQRLHHSLWFTENDVREPLCAFVRSAKLTPWVHVVVGRVVSGGKH